MGKKPKSILIDSEHDTIYRRISELTKVIRQFARILEDEENISDCGKKRLEDLGREIY